MRGGTAALVFAFGVLVGTSGWAGVDLESFDIISPGIPLPNLFTSTGQQGLPGPEAGPGATVAWPVTINLALLDTLPATVRVNFPDRATVTLTRMSSERQGSNALRWSGRGGDCSALFRVASNGFKGTISCISAPYGINHTDGSSSVRLTRYDDSGNAVWEENFVDTIEHAPNGPESPMAPRGLADTTVDVLVLYNGSLTSLNIWQNAHDHIQTIQHAMELSTASGQPLIAQIRLAGAARISRTVSGAPVADRQYLRTDPQTAGLRDYYAGDIVLYLTTGSCELPGIVQGVAYLPGTEGVPPPDEPGAADWAFAVSLLDCSDNPGDWVAAHEIAHVFGANHNQDHIPFNQTPIEDYAWGYWKKELGTDFPRGARTIMSYVQECIAAVSPCPRIQHYSNPGVQVDGWFTTGTATRDNAKLIREYAPLLAQYRDSQGRIFKYGFE